MGNYWLKRITLIFFIGCITLFLLYRSGAFRKMENTSLLTSNSAIADTGIIPRDSLHKALLNDTLPVKINTDSVKVRRVTHLSSSKSGFIVRPDWFIPDTLPIHAQFAMYDSLVKAAADSIKKTKKKL